MKILLPLIFLFAFQPRAFGQEKRIDKNLIPEKIRSYLDRNYLHAKETRYFQRKDRDSIQYEVEFELNKQDYNLRFSIKGNLLETEREIEFNELPEVIRLNVLQAFHDNFGKLKIKKTQEVEPLGIKQYEVYVKVKRSIQYKGGFYKVMFDGSGRLLSIEEDTLYSIESRF